MGAPRSAVLAGLGLGLLGAGFGLGLLVGPGSPPPVTRTVVVEKAPAPPPADSTVPAAASAPAAPPAAGGLSPADRDALRAILEQAPSKEIPSGTGIVSGRVKTEDGRALEAVEVACTPEAPRDPKAVVRPETPLPEPDAVDAALASFQWTAWRKKARRTAATDAAGEFRFEGLADVKHRIEAKKKGWQFQAEDWRTMQEARPGAVVEITAVAAVEVRVEITGPWTTPPKNLAVRLKASNNSSGYGVNPENPVFTTKPGTYEAYASAGDNEEMKSEPQTVEIPAEGDAPVLRFALKGRPGIKGRIVFPEGEDTGQTQVFLQRLARDQKADPAALRSSGGGGGRGGRGGGRQGQDRYSFTDLAPGRYAVGASRTWNGPVVAMEEVEVPDGPVERDLRMPPLDRSEYVVLNVLGPGGETLAEVQITTGYKSKTMTSSGGSTVATRPDGTRWVLHHPHGSTEDPDGVYWIEAASPKYGRKRAEYRRGAQDSVTIQLDEAGRLEVRLEGYKGHPFEGRLRVALWSAMEEASGAWSGGFNGENRVSEEGVQSFLQVQPGDYVVVLLPDSDRSILPLVKVAVAVKAGRNEVPLKVPALHSVTVTGAEGWAMCRPKDEQRFSLNVQVSSDGRAVFEGLPEGEYEVRSGRKTQTIRVPGTTEVKL
jgi:uncharacterized protein (DUF2141 family)